MLDEGTSLASPPTRGSVDESQGRAEQASQREESSEHGKKGETQGRRSRGGRVAEDEGTEKEAGEDGEEHEQPKWKKGGGVGDGDGERERQQMKGKGGKGGQERKEGESVGGEDRKKQGRAQELTEAQKHQKAQRTRLLTFIKWHNELGTKVVCEMLKQLPSTDIDKAKQLLSELHLVARTGEQPSFADASARSGYLQKRMVHRSSLVAAALLHESVTDLVQSKLAQKRLTVLSLGGAGGSDALSLLLLRNFSHAAASICTTVCENERGWKEAVDSLKSGAQAAGVDLRHDDDIHFAEGDVTRPLDDVTNAQISAVAAQADVVICAYVLVENSKALLEQGLGVVPSLLRAAPPAALFLFLDNSHLLWPPVIETAAAHGVLRREEPRWTGQGLQAAGNLCRNPLVLVKPAASSEPSHA